MTLTNLDLPFLGVDGQTEIKLMAQQTPQCSWKNNIPLKKDTVAKRKRRTISTPPPLLRSLPLIHCSLIHV